jgi:dTDP-4-amino-4,6-dideoxygalactose transaminase
MTVNFNNLYLQNKKISNKALKKVKDLLKSSTFILGEDVKAFEDDFKNYIGTQYAIGVNSGTDAIKLACRSLDLKGDIIIFIPANTYIATYTGSYEAYPEAHFEFVDCDESYQINTKDLESKLLKNKNFSNKIVIPVHLYGHSCDMKTILELKSKHDFHIIEDCSQAHGAINNLGKKVGTTGIINAFSLYPGKNLGALGDAGIVTTDSKEIYEKLLVLRNIGSVQKYIHDEFGYNSRLDTVQAIFLNEKLKRLDVFNNKRIKIAKTFLSEIKNPLVSLPVTAKYCKKNVYHAFVIKTEYRNELQNHLNSKNIQTVIHYPRPIYDNIYLDKYKSSNTNVDKNCNQVLSIPMHPFLTDDEISYVIESINNFKI